MKVKICFASSSGGHFEQLMMLKPLMKKYESFIVTEKTKYKYNKEETKIYFLYQVNRKQILLPFYMFLNAVISLKILICEKPNIIITTGVLSIIPLCLIAKVFNIKIIYIESFAKIYSPTRTGRLLYKFADKFYVQWDSMKNIYPKAICKGGLY